MLVDDVLLEIFHFCRKIHYDLPDSERNCWPLISAWNWCLLAHVCRRWRQIIFDSSRRLNLRILCTYRTPVRKNLGIWPAFPIDLRFNSPGYLRPQNEDNVIAALEHRNRVQSVRLSAPRSQWAKLASVMQEPFPVLTHLRISSMPYEDPLGLSPLELTAEFMGGSTPNLQEISLRRVSFPALPILLFSASDLVTLSLVDIPIPGYISPERIIACLAALPRLKMLEIRYNLFHVSSGPNRIRPPPETRAFLPALTDFQFRCAFDYLEDVVAQIDSPQLERISIKYSDPADIVQVTQLSDFINRTIGPSLTPSRRAHVYFYFDRADFTLSLENPHASYPGFHRRTVTTTISHDWRFPSVARVFSRFSATLCTVAHLELDAQVEENDGLDLNLIEWLRLLSQFPAMQTLYVSLNLAKPVFLSLKGITAERVTEVLPSLGLICLEREPASSLEKIIAIRRFSDHPITIVETRDEFNERLKSYLSI